MLLTLWDQASLPRKQQIRSTIAISESGTSMTDAVCCQPNWALHLYRSSYSAGRHKIIMINVFAIGNILNSVKVTHVTSVCRFSWHVMESLTRSSLYCMESDQCQKSKGLLLCGTLYFVLWCMVHCALGYIESCFLLHFVFCGTLHYAFGPFHSALWWSHCIVLCDTLHCAMWYNV